MDYELFSQKIQKLPIGQHYVFPRVSIHNSLDILEKNRANPYFHWLNADRAVKNFDGIQKYPLLLLLSEPGFGKSEFLKQYASHLVGRLTQGNVLPLYIELKGYKPNRDLETYIERQVKLRLGIDESLSSLRKTHKIAFLLDGFDEVGKNEFAQIVEEMEVLLSSCHEHQIVISSRLHFYLAYHSFEEQSSTIAHISAFGDDEIREYLEENGNGIEEREIRRLIEMFREPDFSSILTIPRYLEKYVELYKSGETGRLSKADIYDRFVESRLEIEDEKYPGRTLREFYRNFLEKFALIMEIYQQNEISRSEFMKVLDKLESNLVKAVLSKIDSFEYLSEGNILVNYSGQISFEDRSLQEYLAACEMAEWHDQKKIYDLVFVEELQQINPSWVNTLSYYLDLDSSFFEHAVGFYPELILRSNIANLLPAQKITIFHKILAVHQEKKIWRNGGLTRRISQLYSEPLKAELAKYMDSSAHFVQKGNIALLIGLIPLRGYQKWLIDCVNDCNPNGVLQRHAFFSLGQLGDASVIAATKEKALANSDVSIREAFLNMCGQLDTNGSVSYFLDEFNTVDTAIIRLTEVDGKAAIVKILERLANDKVILERLCGKRDKGIEKIFGHIEAVYDDHIQNLLIQVLLSSLDIHLGHFVSIYRCIAKLLKKKAPPNIWEHILSEALQAEISLHISGFLGFLSYFVTDMNLHKLIGKLQDAANYVGEYDWAVTRLVNLIQMNEENPSHSIIEQKARELLPDYYQKVDKAKEERAQELSQDQQKYIEWKRIFDDIPTEYDSSQIGLILWCVHEFDEKFELDCSIKAKLAKIIESILSSIDPEVFQIIVKEWDDRVGGPRKFSETWQQMLYERALKLNFRLGVGFNDRERLISFLRVLHSTENELLENILRILGTLRTDEIEKIKGFLQEKNRVYTAIHTYIQVVREKRLSGCVDLLKEFVDNEDIEYFHRTECLEVIEKLAHDKEYLEGIFHSCTVDESVKGKAAHLLITEHQDVETLGWQFDQLKAGLQPYDWREGLSADWLARVKRADTIPLYMDLLEASYESEAGKQEHVDWLRRISIEGLKFQKSRQAVDALRGFIDENKDKIEGVNFLEYEFEQVEKDYLLYIGKPDSIRDAVNRYNEIDRKVSRKIPDSDHLFDTIIKIFEEQIKHSIEQERGYRSFYRDIECKQPKTEPEIQPLFLNWRQSFQASGIHMVRERETGRGPVDYSFNYGFVPRIQNCDLEIKLSKHYSIPGGFETQLATYIQADKSDAAIFLVVRIRDENGPIPPDEQWMEYQIEIMDKCKELNKMMSIPIKAIFIDALQKPSASKVKEPPGSEIQ